MVDGYRGGEKQAMNKSGFLLEWIKVKSLWSLGDFREYKKLDWEKYNVRFIIAIQWIFKYSWDIIHPERSALYQKNILTQSKLFISKMLYSSQTTPKPYNDPSPLSPHLKTIFSSKKFT